MPFIAIALALVVTSTPLAQAQVKDYPIKPVNFVNPFAPGGPVDFVGRSVGQELSKMWSPGRRPPKRRE